MVGGEIEHLFRMENGVGNTRRQDNRRRCRERNQLISWFDHFSLDYNVIPVLKTGEALIWMSPINPTRDEEEKRLVCSCIVIKYLHYPVSYLRYCGMMDRKTSLHWHVSGVHNHGQLQSQTLQRSITYHQYIRLLSELTKGDRRFHGEWRCTGKR